MADSPRPVLWEELTWEQITALRDGGMNLVILPVGATEQHALHLRPDLVQLDKAIDEPDRSAGCFFAYTVNKEGIHGGVGSPSKADINFGKTILETCITELSAQLKRAMTEETPLEEMLPPPL